MTITKSSDTTKLYGIFNGSYTNADKDTCVNGFVGEEALNDAVINSGKYAADTLFEITKTGSGEYDIVAQSELGSIAGGEATVSSNALYMDGNRIAAFADKAVVYVYDTKDKAYEVGTLSDIDAADANDVIHYYMTETDSDKDNYNMITYVVINQKESAVETDGFLTVGESADKVGTLHDGSAEIGSGNLKNLSAKWNGSTMTVTGSVTKAQNEASPAFVQYIKVAKGTASVDLYQDGKYTWTATKSDAQWLSVDKGYAKVATTYIKDGKAAPARTYTLVQKDAAGKVIGSVTYTLNMDGITLTA